MQKGKRKRGVPTRDRVRETLDAVVAAFEAGDVPAAVARATFPPADIPLARWSLRNRMLAMLSHTGDARGFRQWQGVGRQVRKGARALYILGPRLARKRDAIPDASGKMPSILVGFTAIPVFRVEDTDGEPVGYGAPDVPEHPLLDVAERWGVTVETAPFSGHAYGWTNGKGVTLCTPEEGTWFHELGHVADGRAHVLTGGQHSDQEIVAELTATVLARLVGREAPNEGAHYTYVARYAERWYPKLGRADAVRKACERVLSRACTAIERIVTTARECAGIIQEA